MQLEMLLLWLPPRASRLGVEVLLGWCSDASPLSSKCACPSLLGLGASSHAVAVGHSLSGEVVAIWFDLLS